MDMILRPEWVEQKVSEVNQAFFEAYQRIYDIIKLPDKRFMVKLLAVKNHEFFGMVQNRRNLATGDR